MNKEEFKEKFQKQLAEMYNKQIKEDERMLINNSKRGRELKFWNTLMFLIIVSLSIIIVLM